MQKGNIMGNFRKDFASSLEAVDAIIEDFRSRGHDVEELPRERQIEGDIEINGEKTIEIKFDLYAKRSGNLCFEMSNGKKPTGIMTTQADEVFYVVPNGTGKNVFVFDTEELRSYIQVPGNVTIKKGGDRRKFDLALVAITKIEEDELPKRTFKIEDTNA